jgi:AcrR family transcriptional regulator
MVKAEPHTKRQRTRATLIDATLAVIAERGLSAVSLDEIARRAGVTKGAIYSNFRSKGELMWAAVDRRRLHFAPEVVAGDPAGQARVFARGIMAAMSQLEREAAFYGELRAYIRADPDLHAQQAAQQKAMFEDDAQLIEEAFGDQLKMPPRVVALAAQALALGFAVQWERTPEEVTEDVVAAAYEALFMGATTRGDRLRDFR